MHVVLILSSIPLLVLGFVDRVWSTKGPARRYRNGLRIVGLVGLLVGIPFLVPYGWGVFAGLLLMIPREMLRKPASPAGPLQRPG